MSDNMKVLVVDDDRRMVKTICDILKVKGYASQAAYTGEEAVERVRSAVPDCVLMDIKMPGINGVEALRMIKDAAPDLPVILMSAYTTDEQATEARARGAYSILTKPVDIQMVLSFLSVLQREESVLVVDDDPLFCKTLSDILDVRGYRVEAHQDPVEALQLMEAGYKLAVILDVDLGKSGGLDALRAIRAKYPTKPVLMVTAYQDSASEAIKKALQIGAYTCLYKPLAAEALVDTIRDIRRRKLRAVLGEPFEHPLQESAPFPAE